MTIEKITQIVADFYNIYYKILKVNGRSNQKQTIAKQMAYVLISDFLPHVRVTDVGIFFNRHHTTIVTGKKVMKEEFNVSLKRRLEYETLHRLIKNKIIEENKICNPPTFKIIKS